MSLSSDNGARHNIIDHVMTQESLWSFKAEDNGLQNSWVSWNMLKYASCSRFNSNSNTCCGYGGDRVQKVGSLSCKLGSFNNQAAEDSQCGHTADNYGNAAFSLSPSPSVCILAVNWARTATTPRSLHRDRNSMGAHVWCHCCQCPSGGL